MWHWRLSSTLGLLLTGRYQPVCAAVYAAPECMARRAFLHAADWLFDEDQHCRRIWLTYRLGRAIH